MTSRIIPHDMRPGTLYFSNKHGPFLITCYYNCSKVFIYFFNTGYERSAEAGDIRKGAVNDNSLVINVSAGRIYKTNNYGDVKVIDYESWDNIKIVFLNTGNEKITDSFSIKKGWIADRDYDEKNRLSPLTQSMLKNKLHYNKETGEFKRKGKNNENNGTIDFYGYLIISIYGKPYRSHRLAWLYVYGKWPKNEIDHIDHDRLNNSIENLRDVTAQENARNKSASGRNTSGQLGVCWFKRDEKWRASITVNEKHIHLGYFDNFNEAVSARKKAEYEYEFHINHGLEK